jgi:hypothetical protein
VVELRQHATVQGTISLHSSRLVTFRRHAERAYYFPGIAPTTLRTPQVPENIVYRN